MIAEFGSCRDASNKSLAAIDANRAGQYDKAIRLHTEALEARLRVHGERSIISAISFNNLGEALLATGRLGAAAGAFAKALVVMEYQEFGGMELGSRVSAATSRDNMARVLEARGDFPGAREMRLKGAAKGHTKCGCEDVRTFQPGFDSDLCESSANKSFLFAEYSAQSPEAPCCPARS